MPIIPTLIGASILANAPATMGDQNEESPSLLFAAVSCRPGLFLRAARRRRQEWPRRSTASRSRIEQLEKTYKSQYPQTPEGANADLIKSQKLELLGSLITNEIMLQQAEKLGLQAVDADVEAELNKMKAPRYQGGVRQAACQPAI